MSNLYIKENLQDIKASQKSLWQEYQQFFLNNDITQLPQFLEAHPELKKSILGDRKSVV